MINILCYGDSNTYGYNPINKTRYDINTRWTGILQTLLGSNFHIIEEGCNSRTTFVDDFVLPYKNGGEYIVPCLKSHAPLDLVIVCLGTNDLKFRLNMTPLNVKKSMKSLLNVIKNFDFETFGSTPKILLMNPIRIDQDIEKKQFANYDITSAQKSEELVQQYKELAKEFNCYYFDAGSVAKPSKIDYVHMMPDGHKAIAEALSKIILDIFNS